MSRTASLRPLLGVVLLSLLPWGCNCGPDLGGADGGAGGHTDGGDGGGGRCGDGLVQPGEACDDGNDQAGDGCSEQCTVEQGWSCPTPGEACAQLPQCGDRVVERGEQCDDGDAESGDGCSGACQLESGWTCGQTGTTCSAARCGDGLVAGAEECDDGDAEADDGCSDLCRLERGYKCPTPGEACQVTTCGDGIPEGTEACDDGDNDLGDGCSPLCTREPECTNGVCTPFCGDGLILPGDTTEGCDDGNTRAGDGCSPSCTVEQGFVCERVTQTPPDTVEIPVVYRDFRGFDLTGGHEDFQNANGAESGIVGPELGSDGKPVYAVTSSGGTTHGAAAFDQWYRDTEGVNQTVVATLALNRQASGAYVFDDQTFFPLDASGWVALGQEPLRTDADGQDRNFSFTSEARYWFEYQGDEVLAFRGDDDVWVFINGKLALDLGGVHSAANGTVDVDAQSSALGLELGGIYEVVVFQAERHTTRSSYRLTLTNFNAAKSSCQRLCGNGGLDPGEECDDGNTVDDDACNNACLNSCQAIEESCSPSQGCCSGLICLDATFNNCDGTTPCHCEPAIGGRGDPGQSR